MLGSGSFLPVRFGQFISAWVVSANFGGGSFSALVGGSFRPRVISPQFQYGRVYKHGLIFLGV